MAMLANHLPCPDTVGCGSSDGYTQYDDGGFCHVCKKSFKADGSKKVSQTLGVKDIAALSSGAAPTRMLSSETMAKFGVKVEYNTATREPLKYYFPYYNKEGEIVAYKVRHADSKIFYSIGHIAGALLFGQQRAGSGSQLLIITEGEFDALAATQLLASCGKEYKVVSLPNGANVKALRENLEWIESFDTVVLNLDNDKAGRKCVEEAIELFSPGKVKVMTLPVKDANDMLLQQRSGMEYYKLLGAAKSYRPDGIVDLKDSWDTLWEEEANVSIPFPWAGLNKKLYGLRKREILTITSGSGMGKSAVTRELEHWLLRRTIDNIGILALEESVGRTAWGLVAIEANLPLAIREERVGISKDDVKIWFEATVGSGRVFTLDHFGSTDEKNLLSKIRYLIKGLQCAWVVLDHLSIVVSAMEDGGDERKNIDSIMTKLRQLVEETGAGLILVSHLRRVSGDKGHEEGHEVSLSHLRGSQAIAQLSDGVIALERNQQADDEKEANLTKVRVLKNRYAGIVGLATHLYYDKTTGRMHEVEDVNEFLGVSPEEVGGV